MSWCRRWRWSGFASAWRIGLCSGVNGRANRANLYGYFQALVGDVDPALSYPEAVRSLTPEDLREAARKYLSPEAFGVVIVRPG